MQDDKASEFEVWHGLAELYSSLSYWNDVEVCLRKAEDLKQNKAETLHTEGMRLIQNIKKKHRSPTMSHFEH